MKPICTGHPMHRSVQRQHGFSLFIVMVILLLSLLVVLGALSVATLNEAIVGSQSDTQRAYGAAEALLDAARLDVRLNGRRCQDATGQPAGLGQPGRNAGFTGSPACVRRYPVNTAEYQTMFSGTRLAGAGIDQCAANGPYHGICFPSSPMSLSFHASTLSTDPTKKNHTFPAPYNTTVPIAERWDNGAHYTQFISSLSSVDYGSSAQVGSGPDSVRLALTGDSANNPQANGKYWVEIFVYQTDATALAPTTRPITPAIAPDASYPFAFRITAAAKGLRGNTLSILRTYYVPYPATGGSTGGVAKLDGESVSAATPDPAGRSLGWHFGR